MNTIQIDSLRDLYKGAEAILDSLNGRNIVAFFGSMGAGKTTLIKEICDQLGVTDTVSSPTFSLVNEYHAADDSSVYHFDFYRINKIEEAYDFGYEEYFYSGSLCLIEWSERIEELLPDNVMKVCITTVDDDSRIITID